VSQLKKELSKSTTLAFYIPQTYLKVSADAWFRISTVPVEKKKLKPAAFASRSMLET